MFKRLSLLKKDDKLVAIASILADFSNQVFQDIAFKAAISGTHNRQQRCLHIRNKKYQRVMVKRRLSKNLQDIYVGKFEYYANRQGPWFCVKWRYEGSDELPVNIKFDQDRRAGWLHCLDFEKIFYGFR